ncbi:MAG: hypothetical protein M9915_15225 [Rhizobacter sp.]|nr:hypothetical protein [Rhizobacter sp.]
MQRIIFAASLMCCLASAALAQDRFPGSEDFIDGLFGEQLSGFRVWRKP